MGFLFDVLIPTLIVLAVAFVWLRTLLSRLIPPRRPADVQDPRRANVHPRGFASSGGYQPVTATYEARPRNVSSEREAATIEPSAGIEQSPRRKRENQAPTPVAAVLRQPRTAQTAQARMLARALDSPASVRTALLIKEVLDPPLSLRRRDGD